MWSQNYATEIPHCHAVKEGVGNACAAAVFWVAVAVVVAIVVVIVVVVCVVLLLLCRVFFFCSFPILFIFASLSPLPPSDARVPSARRHPAQPVSEPILQS